MQLVASGRTNREIAEQLVLSTRTIDMHVRNILAKLGCRSRTEAATRAGELGCWPDWPPDGRLDQLGRSRGPVLSNTDATSTTRFAGKPPVLACSVITSALSAWWTQ